MINQFSAVNDNIQSIHMWLSAEETTVLDNALITMQHLYRSGIVHIQLRRLINEESKLEVEYSINKIQTINNTDLENTTDETDEIAQEEKPGKIQFTLTLPEIDDHKRQLTFCNVDLSEEMKINKLLLNEQLKLLDLISNIHSTMIQLEIAGHPEYQLKKETLMLSDRSGNDSMSPS